MLRKPVWSLWTDDGYHLVDPAGKEVRLPFRKVGELVALLASAPNNCTLRESASRQLWPSADRAARLVNLRRTLSALRATMGHESVVSDRESCGFSSGILVECKGDSSIRGDKDLTAGFVSMLQWSAANNPLQMFDLLRANADFGIGLQPQQLLRLVVCASDKLPQYHNFSGWAAFWRGYALMSTGVSKARTLLQSATERAFEEHDMELFSRAVFWQGACEILLGRPEEAAKLATEASFRCSKVGQGAAKIAQLRATSLLHAGQFKVALDLLQNAGSDEACSALDRAGDEALRGFYWATLGNHEKAALIFGNIKSIETETRFSRLWILRSLTEAHAKVAVSPGLVITELNNDVRAFASGGYAHFELYGRELLALAYHQSGDEVACLGEVRDSIRLRKSLNVAYSRWDIRRLRPVLPLYRLVA